MRASLLAIATATSLKGLASIRRFRPASQRIVAAFAMEQNSMRANHEQLALDIDYPSWKRGPIVPSPPEEFCRGVSPKKAANSRGPEKTEISGTLASKGGGSDGTDAGNGHQPAGRFISFGGRAIISLIALPDLAIEFGQLAHQRQQRRAHNRRDHVSLASMMRVAKARALFGPSAAMIPISARWLRRALSSCVRWPTRSSRTLWCMSAAWFSTRSDWNKTHGRSRHRLADGRCIRGVVLLAAHISLHIGQRHQPDVMAKLHQLAAPVMGRATCLQPNKTQLSCRHADRIDAAKIDGAVDIEGDKPAKKKFKPCPIGFFHIDIAKVQTAEGKLYLFVAIDDLHCREHGIEHRFSQDQSSLDQRSGRTNEPNDQGRDRHTVSLRRSQSVAAASRRLRQRLQFRLTPEDAQRPRTLRVNLKMLEIRPATIQTQPAPANAGTEQLGFAAELINISSANRLGFPPSAIHFTSRASRRLDGTKTA